MTIEQAIEVEREVKAPPSAVFAYLTDSEKWSRWQGAEATIDATPGGIFRMMMGDGSTARGQFTEIELNSRVVFTWGWVDHPGVPPGSSTVEIDLEESASGTLIRLKHRGLGPDELPFHRMGWEHYLPRLVVVSEGRDPGEDAGPS